MALSDFDSYGKGKAVVYDSVARRLKSEMTAKAINFACIVCKMSRKRLWSTSLAPT